MSVVFNYLRTRTASAVPSANDTTRPPENRVVAPREQGSILDAWQDEGGSPAKAASAFANPLWDRYIDGDIPD